MTDGAGEHEVIGETPSPTTNENVSGSCMGQTIY